LAGSLGGNHHFCTYNSWRFNAQEEKVKRAVAFGTILLLVFGDFLFAGCPSYDLNGDCFIDYEDFAEMGDDWLTVFNSQDLVEMAIQWLTTDPCVPDDIVYIPDGEFEMGDHFEPEGDLVVQRLV
jgi:hypothetical protein